MSKYVIVGSYAWHSRNPYIQFSDIDVWYCGDKPQLNILDNLIDYKEIPEYILDYFETTIPTLDELYTIKCSHLGWSNPMWDKNKQHTLLMSQSGAGIIPKLYNMLVHYWKQELGDKTFLSLNKTKETFFTDHVNYLFDHDNLHLEVAYPEKPIYQSVLKENREVLICKDKFDKLPFMSKVVMFQEEIYTIALERWLLNPYWLERDLTIAQAHFLSLQKTITNLTKNWACDFIVQNLEHFNVPNYFTYRKVINKLLSNKQKEKYMKDSNVIEFMKSALCEVKLNFPQYLQNLDTFIYECAEGDLYPRELEEFLGYKHLEQEGGGEGGAEDCHGVFKIKDKIFKAYYTYQSYNGHEYDEIQESLREVVPVQKTITVYE